MSNASGAFAWVSMLMNLGRLWFMEALLDNRTKVDGKTCFDNCISNTLKRDIKLELYATFVHLANTI